MESVFLFDHPLYEHNFLYLRILLSDNTHTHTHTHTHTNYDSWRDTKPIFHDKRGKFQKFTFPRKLVARIQAHDLSFASQKNIAHISGPWKTVPGAAVAAEILRPRETTRLVLMQASGTHLAVLAVQRAKATMCKAARSVLIHAPLCERDHPWLYSPQSRSSDLPGVL